MDDIRDIASCLDDVIEKAEKKKPLKKSLSFNPIKPHAMSPESGYYNPYRMLADGSYAPHSPEYWTSMGRDPEQYREVREFYQDAGYYKEKMREKQADKMAVELSGNSRFVRARRALDDLKKSIPKYIDAKMR